MPAAVERRSVRQGRSQRRSRPRTSSAGAFLGYFNSSAYGPPWNAVQGTGVTASGIDLRDGRRRYIVATGSNLPFGTHLYIWPNPYGWRGTFEVADRGGAIGPANIDFFVAEGRARQLLWGRRNVRVWQASAPNARGGARFSGNRAFVAFDAGIPFVPDPADLVDPFLPDIPNPFDLIPGVPDPGDVNIPGPGDVLGALGSIDIPILSDVADFFVAAARLFFTPEGWLRLGKLLGGAILVLWGLNRLATISTGVNPARAVRRATGSVAIGARAGRFAAARVPAPSAG